MSLIAFCSIFFSFENILQNYKYEKGKIIKLVYNKTKQWLKKYFLHIKLKEFNIKSKSNICFVILKYFSNWIIENVNENLKIFNNN